MAVITWTEFAAAQPELADAGRADIYQWGLGLGFLATVRADGGPRVHPVCPVIGPAGLLVLIAAGPKQRDLLRDGRYSLHSETFAPPREDDGFAVSGIARQVADPAAKARCGAQIQDERNGAPLWPTFDEDLLFELTIDRALLMRTAADAAFPKGPTIWHP